MASRCPVCGGDPQPNERCCGACKSKVRHGQRYRDDLAAYTKLLELGADALTERDKKRLPAILDRMRRQEHRVGDHVYYLQAECQLYWRQHEADDCGGDGECHYG